jgi:crotonobetainyl-CoA:carnitine CoA-transferase CaiB-like acyl-CoA transferase
VAGPIATRILADHGADVIKVERRKTLDLGERRGGFFGNLNRGKRSIILDLSNPRGIDLARRLAAKSDVVIDNFSARVMPHLGLDYASLAPLRDDIITIGMSGFGTTGPCKDYVSFGPTLHALSGHTWLMRPEGKDPAGWGFSHSDVCAGLGGAIAVLAALLHRARTGEGQAIELSQLESVTALMGPMLVEIANGGEAPLPSMNRPQEAPARLHGIYRAAGDDRWVAIAVFEEAERHRLAEIAGDEVEAWTSRRSAQEITEICQRAGIAAFTVANGEDLGSCDRHLQARHYWANVRTPEGETVTLDGVTVKLSATPGRVDGPGPLHGEHGEQVLAEVLGLTGEEIAELGPVTRAAAARDGGARPRF